MNRRVRVLLVVVAAMLAVLLGAVPAWAVSVAGTGTVEGTVRGTTGVPIPGYVSLYGITGGGTLHATGLYSSVDASGHFVIKAPNTEQYKLYYSLSGDTYPSVFWKSGGLAPTGALGETVTISLVTTVTCDATIPAGFKVSGHVRRHANGAGIGSMEVYPWVLDPATGQWVWSWGWTTSGGTDAGAYGFTLLGGYKYRLQWGSEYTSYPWDMGFWNGASLFSRATTITATAGGSVTADVSLRVHVDTATVAGTDRVQTSIAASKLLYPDDGSGDGDAVVIATGYDWPDALAGASLAYAADGPLLLTKKAPASMPASLVAEVHRLKTLGASRAYILGGPSTVATAVADQLSAEFGEANVHRLGGANRYETSAIVASNTIERRGPGNYDGTVMIATGKNYADAMAASPVSAKMGWPILLAQPDGTGGLSDAMTAFVAAHATKAIVLGSESAVASGVASDLATALGGSSHVERWSGGTRVDTALDIAEHAIAYPGSPIGWNGLAFSYGWNYPDALCGGPLLAGGSPSVILLTPNTNKLTPTLKARLQSLAASATVADGAVVDECRFLGGTSTLGAATRAALLDALQ